jgi:predicted TIM-barrel fold metal-dependent hydrolase
MKLLEGRNEEILEPDLHIVDAHHHIWDRPVAKYMLREWLADISAGHKIVASVYCEASAFYRNTGPEWKRPLGEVEFANGLGAIGASGHFGECRFCAGIVGKADLTLGARVGELLDLHLAAAPERFRGVRQITLAYPTDLPFRSMPHIRQSQVLDSVEFPLALDELDKRGLSYDAAVFDPSIPRLAEVADRFPNLIIILNHLGMAVGMDMDAKGRAEVFRRWSAALRELAKRQNVFCKIGGLGMTVWGFGFENYETEVTYLDLAEVWAPYVETAIHAFGPERCMLESNYPPDAMSGGYVPIWNAYKHILRSYSPAEKSALFARTAARAYRLELEII